MSTRRNKKSGSKKVLKLVKTPPIVRQVHILTSTQEGVEPQFSATYRRRVKVQAHDHVHGEECNHDHTEEHPHKARNEAKTERKVKAAVKGSLTQERTLRPRTARRRAVRALRKVETLQRKQERAEADKAGLPTPENTKVRWHLDSRR